MFSEEKSRNEKMKGDWGGGGNKPKVAGPELPFFSGKVEKLPNKGFPPEVSLTVSKAWKQS